MTKLSTALLLLTSTTTTASSTSQDWYAASQARSLLHAIRQRTSSSQQHRSLSSTHYSGSRSFHRLQKHQPPSPTDILNSLSQYDKLWIEIKPTETRSGPCVWSECELDNVDEDYTGDNRDGDSQWYQFRTQEFCANAAYSLYGRKKGDVLGTWGDCTGRHFINSFFTYGGSDNLLKAVGKTPAAYLGGDSNADCVESDNGYSTMGCTASGDFLIGYFGGNTCDGNYYSGGDSSSVTQYNKDFRSVQCHEMSASADSSALYALLTESWACDVRTFDNSCPDPFQRKGFYEYALQTAQNGGNPMRAYNHLLWKAELRLFSWVLLAVSILLFFAAFSIKQCAIKKRPDGVSSLEGSYEDQVSPTASHMTVGSTLFELEDGGKLKNVMEKVSARTLAAAAWVQWKIGMGKEPEPERTFQTSSPENKSDFDGYKSPEKMARSPTPSTARKLDMCLTDESALELPPIEVNRTSTSPNGKVVEGGGEDKPWVTMTTPRQSLQ